MDENYIEKLRKSLSTKKRSVTNSNRNKQTNSSLTLDSFKSENVFEFNTRDDKLKNKNTTFHKKGKVDKRKTIHESSDDSFIVEPRKFKSGKKKQRKRRCIITLTSDSDENPEILMPSRSEISSVVKGTKERFSNPVNVMSSENNDSDLHMLSKNSVACLHDSEADDRDKQISSVEKQDVLEISSDSDDFSLDSFFCTREYSSTELAKTEHTNFDFVSDYMNEVKITNKKVYDTAELRKSESNSVIEIDDEEHDQTLPANSTVDWEALDANSSQNSELQTNVSTEAISGSGFESLIQEQTTYSEEENTAVECSENHFQSVYETCKSKAEYYTVDNDKIVILKQYSKVPFFGYCKLKVLYGKVEILGSTVNVDSPPISLYSPRGSALLCIANVTDDQSSAQLSQFLPFLYQIDCFKKKVLEQYCAVIKLAKLKDNRIPFIEKYVAQQIFPKISCDNLPQVIFEPKDIKNIITVNPEWDTILDNVHSMTKLMVTGGKGVGKSTFIRYAINRLLMRFERIRVIDLDPGQPEFTVPGMISVLSVANPVFGPNYTHLIHNTERSYLTNINVGYNPRHYLKCVSSLMTYTESLKNLPTLVNYMGFVQSLGLNIAASAITYIKPTDLIQINSKQRKKNFKDKLTVDVIKENFNLLGYGDMYFFYNLYQITAMNDGNDGWTLEPRQAREMCVLAYLAEMLPEGIISFTDYRLPMYKINMNAIKMSNLKTEQLHPADINASLVALCEIDEDNTLFICYGYGVVRGVDLQKDILVLITPEKQLKRVVHLVLDSVSLPPSIYLTPDEVTGMIPYVMEGELSHLGQITRRSYLPANKV